MKKKPGEMNGDYRIIIERDEEGYFVASVPELQGCHAQARSLDTLMERIREAIELCLEVDDFDREIELARQNKALIKYLDERGKEKVTIPLKDLEEELGLAG
jgi:predicted RNase H-like HicB family nuclease